MMRMVSCSLLVLMLMSGLAHAQSPPAPPIISPGSGAVDVPLLPAFLWNSAGEAVLYELQVSTSPAFDATVIDVPDLTDTAFTPAEPLTPLTTYHWRVRAYSGTDTSPWSPVTEGAAFTTGPAAPSAPLLTSPSNGAVDLGTVIQHTWEPVSEAGRYIVEIAADDLFTVIVHADTNVSDASFTPPTPLEPGATYFWRVCAVNTGGHGAWSLVWHYTTYPSVPPSPVLLAPVDGEMGAVPLPVLVWHRTPGTDSYTVQESADSLFTTAVMETAGLKDTTMTAVTPLDSAVRYYWRVRAANGGGEGEWSARWSFVVIGEPPALPVLVSPVDNAVDIWPDTVLTWEALPRALTYNVQVSTDPEFIGQVIDTAGIDGSAWRVTGLLRATRYYWRVQGVNAVGTGSWSSPWSFVTVPEVPPAVVLQYPASGATEVPNPPTFRWLHAEGAATYEIQVAFRTDFEDDSLIISESGLTDTSFTPSFIMDGGTLYNWRIRAINAGGPGEWSAGWQFTTKLEAPFAVALYAPDNGATGRLSSVLMGWWGSTDNPADSFHLQISTDSLFGRMAVDVTGITGTERLVTGLAYSETYYWRVNATNRVGTGPWSPVWYFSTLAGSPRAPSLSTPADGAIDLPLTPVLAWIPGGGEDSFTLQVALTSNFSSPVINVAGIVDTSYAVPGPLQGLTVHYWRVRAVNASGNSSWTGVRSFTTLLPPPGTTVALPADSVTAHSFLARWSPVAGATSYFLDVSLDSLFGMFLPGYEDLGVTDTSRSVSGVEPGIQYYYRVRAVHAGGTGPSSNVICVLTPGIVIRVRALLSGPYAGDTMSTALRDAGLIPLSQPYAGEPWSYAGTEQVDSLPLRVVDWVLLELRTDSVTVAGRRAALLLADGTVTDLDGQSPVFMADMAAGSYFIVLRHRNHLAAMAAEAIAASMASTMFDFTTGPDKYYGGDAKAVDSGVHALWCGDVTANGQVKYSGSGNDRSPILTRLGGADLTLIVNGYHLEDVNMDGHVKYSGSGNDRSLILQTIGGADLTAARATKVPNP